MTTAVLVMAYGTPANRDAVETFYTDVRRGRPPSAEQLAELLGRYDAIGGVSPLNQRTAAQIDELQRALEHLDPGAFCTFYGAKHAEPKIEAAIAAAAERGCAGLVGLVLAPHYSALSIGEYVARASAAAQASGLESACLLSWHDEPALIAALAARVRGALSQLSTEQAAKATVLFSAHSLPAKIIELDDPYPAELQATADAVAAACSLRSYRTAWQSAGRTGEPWLGPDIVDVIDELADAGTSAVVVCPAGFTSDHLEVLYDLDIVASERARARGIAFVRTASLNAEPAVFAALADRVAGLAAPLQQRSQRA